MNILITDDIQDNLIVLLNLKCDAKPELTLDCLIINNTIK
jgi:hypothetical protein